MKRYNMVIPDQLYNEIIIETKRRKMSFIQAIRQGLSIWLLIAKNEDEVSLDIAGKSHKLII